MIRERDGKCVLCGDTQRKSECSHYWSRGDKMNRWNPKNAEYLCFTCHLRVEANKQGEYRDYKIRTLGEEEYRKMEIDHYQKTKHYGKYEKELLYGILSKQYKEKAHLKKDWTVEW